MRRSRRSIRARLRGALWPIPAVAVVLAIGAGFGLPAVDGLLENGGSGHPLAFVFGGGPAAARDLLAAIAGSLISVTGLTFSLTVVALQLGSSQYSPRLLQTFVTDRGVQVTLAVLTATFVYALTVLRTVRTEDATTDESAFVPRLSITVAYLLTLGSVLALLLFLGHLAQMLRVETMLRDVHDEGSATLARELPDVRGDRLVGPVVPRGPGTPVPATSSGFLVGVDEAALVRAARGHGAVVLLAARIGDSVVTGTPIAHAWPEPAHHTVDADALGEALAGAVHLGFERSPDRDLSYGLRKVVDVAVRALSPGTNDPTTAVHALSHASALLGDLVTRPLEACRLADDGVLRAVVPQWSATELLDLALEEPLQYASGQPAVLRRLAALLREVAWRAPGGQLDRELRAHLAGVVAEAGDSTRVGEPERREWEQRLEQALAGTWAAEPPR